MYIFDNLVVTGVTDILSVSMDKGTNVQINNRDSYGLSFCIDGQITYSHLGKKYISDKTHAVILPKGQNYSLHCDKKGFFPVINFECTDFLCDTITVLPASNTNICVRDFEQMKSLSVFGKNRAKIISLFYNIIYTLHAYNEPNQYPLIAAMEYLENNYSNPEITNEALAKRCNISEVYFRKLFIKTYGITPRQFIIDARISKAKLLLMEGRCKISTVSENCGFSNPYHFCRLFKQRTGVTPTEFMARNKTYKI